VIPQKRGIQGGKKLDKKILERRTQMLRLSLMGIPLDMIIEKLLADYGGEEKRLYTDWERRRQWIPHIVQLEDPTLLHKFLEGARIVLPKAWLLAEDSKNGFVKLGALKLIKDTNLEILKILQSVGAVEKKPTQVNVMAIEGFEADPELKRALVEEAERQRKQHDEQQPPPPT
jgi:hypothetical protein